MISIHAHPIDKMLPKETAHARITWYVLVNGHWVKEDKGEISRGIRAVYKKRHKKKCRSFGKRLVREQVEG